MAESCLVLVSVSTNLLLQAGSGPSCSTNEVMVAMTGFPFCRGSATARKVSVLSLFTLKRVVDNPLISVVISPLHLFVASPPGYSLDHLQTLDMPMYREVQVTKAMRDNHLVVPMPYVGEVSHLGPEELRVMEITQSPKGFVVRGHVSYKCADDELIYCCLPIIVAVCLPSCPPCAFPQCKVHVGRVSKGQGLSSDPAVLQPQHYDQWAFNPSFAAVFNSASLCRAVFSLPTQERLMFYRTKCASRGHPWIRQSRCRFLVCWHWLMAMHVALRRMTSQ